MEDELRYDIAPDSEATIEKIRKLAREVWRELREEGSLAREEAERAGILLEDIPENMEEVLTLKPSGAGFEPGSVALIAAGMVLHGAGRAALDVWKYVLLPRIREKWGDHALKRQSQAAKKAATAAATEDPSSHTATKKAPRKKPAPKR